MATFKIYTDTRGEYRWRLKAANGKIVADSGEGYISKQGAHNDIEWVKTYAKGAGIVEE